MTRFSTVLVAFAISASIISVPASAAIADRGWVNGSAGGNVIATKIKAPLLRVVGIAF